MISAVAEIVSRAVGVNGAGARKAKSERSPGSLD
jgi:hypothetical protein